MNSTPPIARSSTRLVFGAVCPMYSPTRSSRIACTSCAGLHVPEPVQQLGHPQRHRRLAGARRAGEAHVQIGPRRGQPEPPPRPVHEQQGRDLLDPLLHHGQANQIPLQPRENLLNTRRRPLISKRHRRIHRQHHRPIPPPRPQQPPTRPATRPAIPRPASTTRAPATTRRPPSTTTRGPHSACVLRHQHPPRLLAAGLAVLLPGSPPGGPESRDRQGHKDQQGGRAANGEDRLRVHGLSQGAAPDPPPLCAWSHRRYPRG